MSLSPEKEDKEKVPVFGKSGAKAFMRFARVALKRHGANSSYAKNVLAGRTRLT
jgi:hypothetical protein